MDGIYEFSDSDLRAMRERQEISKEKLEKMKEFYSGSLGKVFLRNPEFTSKKNDRRVFKVEYVNTKMGVLFSTIDDTKYLAESSLYIPFNTDQVNFLCSLVEQTEPIENYRIKYYEKKIHELQNRASNLELEQDLTKSTLGHFQKMISEEQHRLGERLCTQEL